MKTNIFKSFLIGSALAIVAISASAQSNYTAAAGTYDAVTTTSDYVTVGSRLPYYVAPDAGIDALITLGSMSKSNFKWNIFQNDGVTSAGITPKSYSNAALSAGGAAGYVLENEISAVWSVTAQALPYKVQAIEHSIPGSGIFANGCDDASAEIRDVYVLPVPTVAANGSTADMGCGITPSATTIYQLPIDLTGIGPWDVTYDVTYNGSAYLTAQNQTITIAQTITDPTVYSVATTVTPATGANGLQIVIDGATAANGFGKYIVTITSVKDKISKKDLNSTVTGTVGGTAYSIFVNPTPQTGKVQHLAN